MARIKVSGQFAETVSGIGSVTFDPLERGSTYFHPQASHRQRFAFEANGREYWGEIIRTRIGNARPYSVEVELMTRNARTGHGVNVREGALILYREALAKAFREHIAAYLAEIESADAGDVREADGIESGHAGPDWEPTDATRFYAQRTGDSKGGPFAFGPTREAAIAALPAVEPVKVGTIDLTPTWAGILPALLAALTDGTPEGQRIAREELARMARIADASVTYQQQRDGESARAVKAEALAESRLADAVEARRKLADMTGDL